MSMSPVDKCSFEHIPFPCHLERLYVRFCRYLCLFGKWNAVLLEILRITEIAAGNTGFWCTTSTAKGGGGVTMEMVINH